MDKFQLQPKLCATRRSRCEVSVVKLFYRSFNHAVNISRTEDEIDNIMEYPEENIQLGSFANITMAGGTRAAALLENRTNAQAESDTADRTLNYFTYMYTLNPSEILPNERCRFVWKIIHEKGSRGYRSELQHRGKLDWFKKLVHITILDLHMCNSKSISQLSWAFSKMSLNYKGVSDRLANKLSEYGDFSQFQTRELIRIVWVRVYVIY
jgi:hypothetical protein